MSSPAEETGQRSSRARGPDSDTLAVRLCASKRLFVTWCRSPWGEASCFSPPPRPRGSSFCSRNRRKPQTQLCRGRDGAGSVRLPQPHQGKVPASQLPSGKGYPPTDPFPGGVPGEGVGGAAHLGACRGSGAALWSGLSVCPGPWGRARAAGQWGRSCRGRGRLCPGGRRRCGGRSSCGGSRWWTGAAGCCWPWRRRGGCDLRVEEQHRSGGETPGPAAPGRPRLPPHPARLCAPPSPVPPRRS